MNFRYKQLTPDLHIKLNELGYEVGVWTQDNKIVYRQIHSRAAKIYLNSHEIGNITRFNDVYLVNLYQYTFEVQKSLKSNMSSLIWRLIDMIANDQKKQIESMQYRYTPISKQKIVG